MTETPMFKQYLSFKEKYPDAVLFFRLGDFYEMFGSDAKEVSSLLSLTLTQRTGEPMCGIPYHAANTYIKKLLDLGKKIAICEQLSLVDSYRGLAKRDIIRVITPGTVVEENFLEQNKTNYILSVFQSYAAFCDISTGEFYLKNIDPSNRKEGIRELIEQTDPKEILVCEDEYFTNRDFRALIDSTSVMTTKLAPWYFSVQKAFVLLCEQSGMSNLKAFGLSKDDKILSSAGALLKYLRDTSKDGLKQITGFEVLEKEIYLSMDESTRKNLEIFKNLYDGKAEFSLFNAINRCKTLSGGRLLKEFLSFPLRKIEAIKERQSWGLFYKNDVAELKRIRDILSSSSDLNRLLARILMKKAAPHDVVGVADAIDGFVRIISVNTEKYRELFTGDTTEENFNSVLSLKAEIERAVNPDFLGLFNPGNVIKTGYDEELDRLRLMKEQSSSVLMSYLESEKEKSGITILKLGYNKIIGYFLEVPKGQAGKVPAYFIRRQTLVGGERFTTDTLEKYEREILSASSMAEEREKTLFDALCEKIEESSKMLKGIANFISLIDVYASFATLALDSDYVMPEMTNDDVLEIRGGRHPVVEKQTGKTRFTANDADMKNRFFLITGPNMAGKSTYLRQNAIIILLAHIGCFVPASYAKIGIVDKIFCRVGAMDNLARGESTFLIEMQETSYILRNCTERSFVIVDEIGRGTSTQDGMAIAYAVMKNLIKKGCKTLFATHYHELTLLDNTGISLKTLEVNEKNGSVEFLRRVIDGRANSSYGLHVAKLAGMPYSVLKEAASFQNKHMENFSMDQSSLFTLAEEPSVFPDKASDSKLAQVREILDNTNIDECTPMNALMIISELKKILEG